MPARRPPAPPAAPPTVPATFARVGERLEARYLPGGPAPLAGRPGTLLASLIRTILGQQNTRAAADRQYAALRETYPRWEAALLDGPDGIEGTLKAAGGGLHRSKARHLHALLEALDDTGTLSLEGLRDLPDPAARARLEALPGVGRHTPSRLRLVDLRRAAMPVEGNRDRLPRRLEWVPGGWTPARVERWFDALTPRTWEVRAALHVAGVRHGREVCTARHPRCDSCVLSDLCPSAALLGPA
ncbi:endonuclease III domain-containing protein [Deinococcus sp.]|uniref:endonuclease III domain-containing protein n=1 Tax=Deinococcus sp. TaxID=47478 RepID=UPI00391C9513